MPISEIRYEREEAIAHLSKLVDSGAQLIQEMRKNPDAEHEINSWLNTSQKVLRNSFSDDEVAKSFFLNSQIIETSQKRRNHKENSIQTIEKSIKFIVSLIEDVKNGLHSRKLNYTFDLLTTILIIKRILANFHLHLKTMYQDDIHGSAKIKIEGV